MQTLEKPIWMSAAQRELGVSEIPGGKDNPRILEYQKATLLQASNDETPWCSAFVNWCFLQCQIQGTRSAAARSWLNWGKPLSQPQYGCVVVLKRGSQAWQGHVGFYVKASGKDHFLMLGGNQGDKVCIESFKCEDVLGYRWPNGIIS